MLIWRASTQSDRNVHGIPVADADRVYAVVQGVSAYSSRDGSLVWRTALETYAPRNLSIGGGRVYAAEATVHALDARTGAVLWRFRPDDNASLGRSVFDNGVLYFGTSSHRVYALDAATGRELWRTDVGPEWQYAGTVRGVVASGDTVYAGVEEWRAANGYIASGWLIALERATGRVLWRFQTGAGNERHSVSASPVVAGRLLLANDVSSNAVFAVDRFTRQEVWRLQGERGFVGFFESPVVRGNTVYAASGDTHAYAAELGAGRLLWRTALPAANQSSALCGQRLLVNYVGIGVLDAVSGRLLRTGYDGEDEFLTSAFAVLGNRAYVFGNKAAYAFRCD
jgi:outer membrane protein assembly factor BamB